MATRDKSAQKDREKKPERLRLAEITLDVPVPVARALYSILEFAFNDDQFKPRAWRSVMAEWDGLLELYDQLAYEISTSGELDS